MVIFMLLAAWPCCQRTFAFAGKSGTRLRGRHCGFRAIADAQTDSEATELSSKLQEDRQFQARTSDLRPRPFLGTLWEQWGLLGLAVGIAVAASGLSIDMASLEGSFSSWSETAQEIQQGAAGAASTSLSMLSLDGALTQAAPEVEELAELGFSPVQEAEAQLARAAGRVPVMEATSVAAASLGEVAAFGAIGGFAGLIVQGVKDPSKSSEADQTVRKRPNYFVPSATFEDGLEADRPMPAWDLATSNFQTEWRMLVRAARFRGASRRTVPRYVDTLELSNEAVAVRERRREQVPTPPPVRVAYDVLCWFIDVVFEDRPIQRFWFLETVARMPYFAYTSVLHLYETFGWWRSPKLRAVHAAQEDNELHHLLIMESLGGDQRWLDRFFAQHGAVAYYWLLIAFFAIDPKWSYNFSRLIEAHAVDTYGEFVDANEPKLRKLPPPPIAVEYYLSEELYLFDKFQTARGTLPKRRPPCATLFDVFSNVRDDEEQHVLTMQACEGWSKGGSPPVPLGYTFNSALKEEEYIRKVTQSEEGREAWLAWGDEVSQTAKAMRQQRF